MAQMPDPFPSLLARIKRIEDRLNQRLASSPFFGTPIRPQADGSVQSDDFDGDLATDDAGTKGWALSSLKAAFGELILRPGSVGNDALTNPIEPVSVHADAQNFTVTPTDTTIMTATVAVPSGFTRGLIVSSSIGATALNSTASTDWLFSRISIPVAGGDLPGWTIGSQDVPAGQSGVAWQMNSYLLTGLSGSFAINGQVASAFGNWAANAGNTANLDVSILFLR